MSSMRLLVRKSPLYKRAKSLPMMQPAFSRYTQLELDSPLLLNIRPIPYLTESARNANSHHGDQCPSALAADKV